MEKLNKIAEKNKWICEYDDFDSDDEDDNSEVENKNEEFGNPHKLNYEKMYNELLIENKRLVKLLLEKENISKVNYETKYNLLLDDYNELLNQNFENIINFRKSLSEKENSIQPIQIIQQSDIIKSNKVKSKINNTRILDKKRKCQLTNEDLILISSI